MRQVDRWFEVVSSWLLPPRCVLCHGRGRHPGIDLCMDCESELPQLPRPCLRCGLPRAISGERSTAGCGLCSRRWLPFDRCYAPYTYAAPLDGLIQDLKYTGALANARVLGTLLGQAAATSGLHLDVDLVVPLPLHTTRLVERGFNQSHEIARFVARCIDRRCEPNGLRRLRATAPQVGLPRLERAANVACAFRADGSRVAGRRVVLLDDVVTTGSTACAAAEALRAAGAVAVDVWSVARVTE